MADPTELNEFGGRYEAPTLSEEFLNALVAELDNDDIVGIILGGSFARGEEDHIATLILLALCAMR